MPSAAIERRSRSTNWLQPAAVFATEKHRPRVLLFALTCLRKFLA
jgi:hypothetical protein